jgi:predicted esterase
VLVAAALLALAPVAQPPVTTPAGHLVHQSRVFELPDDAVGYIPASANLHPPLLVLLHGAGRDRLGMIQHFEAEADKRGIVLLAPTSRGPTWDAVGIAERVPSPDSPLANKMSRSFDTSRDSKRVDAAIANLAKIVPVDRSRTVLAGFSDGATFALAMGMSRYEQFAAVIAWSPGIPIETEGPARGRRVFVSHGRQDPLLSFETTCAGIVPLLRNEGAAVTFLPFDGVHEAPPRVKDAFLDAVFGPVPGTKAVQLPASVPVCHGQGTRDMDRPGTYQSEMMGPH